MPRIDFKHIDIVAERIRSISSKIERMNVFDERFYPPKNTPHRDVLMYFLTMVAIDHRLHRPGKVYEAFIDGTHLRGSDLLYYLGARKFRENPAFFHPENLSKINTSDIISWLGVGETRPPDPEIRAHLLQDLGLKLMELFDGDPLQLLRISKGRLRRSDGYGLIDLLKVFKAYQDPVEKKIMLLIKFLIYRGLIDVEDKEHLSVPVDNHLVRIAIRLGIVELEDEYISMIKNGEEVSHDDDITIRMCVRKAYDVLAMKSSIDVLLLDDMLWIGGRTVCIAGTPRCTNCTSSPMCLEGRCVFLDICKAYRSRTFLDEHRFFNTWYY